MTENKEEIRNLEKAFQHDYEIYQDVIVKYKQQLEVCKGKLKEDLAELAEVKADPNYKLYAKNSKPFVEKLDLIKQVGTQMSESALWTDSNAKDKFNAIVRNVKTMFSNDKDFIKKFKSEMKSVGKYYKKSKRNDGFSNAAFYQKWLSGLDGRVNLSSKMVDELKPNLEKGLKSIQNEFYTTVENYEKIAKIVAADEREVKRYSDDEHPDEPLLLACQRVCVQIGMEIPTRIVSNDEIIKNYKKYFKAKYDAAEAEERRTRF